MAREHIEVLIDARGQIGDVSKVALVPSLVKQAFEPDA
jgi:hypothetical protein